MVRKVPTIINQTIPLDDSAVMMHLNIGLAVFALDDSSQPTFLPSAVSSFSKSWTWNVDVSMKRFPRQQKRSAFMALLPTPPRTYRRYKRGCDYDSESDDSGNQDPVLSSTDEEAYQAQTKSLKGWWRRSVLVSRTKVRHNLRRIWMRDIDEEGTDAVDLSSTVPLLYRNLWNNHIQRLEKASNRWISQLYQIHLITLSRRHHFSKWVLKHLVTPIMRSPLWHMFCELFISLSCGVRREYQDLLYNHKENRPLSPPPPSDVPSSFPTHRKENIKEGPLVDAGTSKGLRWSKGCYWR